MSSKYGLVTYKFHSNMGFIAEIILNIFFNKKTKNTCGVAQL